LTCIANAGDGCNYKCIIQAACNGTEWPCNNHTLGMTCYRCGTSESIAVCTPYAGGYCHGSLATCGDQYVSTCTGSPLKCLGGQQSGKCYPTDCDPFNP